MLRTLAFVAVLATVAVAAPRTPTGQPLGKFDLDLLQAEIRAWKDAGKPDFVHFPNGNQQPVLASIVGNQSAHGHGLQGVGGWFIFPSADDIKFHLFTKQDDSDIYGQVVQWSATNLLDAGFDTKLPTKVIVHGFTNNIESPMIQDIKNAYLASGSHNVIGVDWGALCPGPLYFASRAYVGTAGDRVGDLLSAMVQSGLLDVDNLHLVGHSLGAHVAGLASKKLFKVTGKRPNRITGLDPAWPLFFVTSADGRLDKQDADLVDVIHTCANDLGFPWAIGTSDYFPNGGSNQPGCSFDATGACSHAKSFQYFAETIVEGNGYQGVYCETALNAMDGKCTSQADGCMGEKVYFKESGSYYLTTDDNGLTTPCQLP